MFLNISFRILAFFLTQLHNPMESVNCQVVLTFFAASCLLPILLIAGLTVVFFWLFLRRRYRTAALKGEGNEAGVGPVSAVHEAMRKSDDEKHGGDTVKYIRSIQDALLSSSRTAVAGAGHFILFRPLEAVSGDFYWIYSAGGRQIIVISDCTGHGLHGAFLSILGMTLLNRIVIAEMIYRPDEILGHLRDEVIRALKHTTGDDDIRDGMDMAVCSFDKEKGTLLYSGANSPLYLVREGRLVHYSPDKMPVSVHYRMDPFSLNTIELKKGDTFYIFSDGYADQPGGPVKRKFMSERLKNLLAEMEGFPMNIQRDRLDSTFLEWKGENPQIDDVTILGVRY